MSEQLLIRRVRAAESAVTRFSGKPFKWGENDCIRLVAHTMRELDLTPNLAAGGFYSTMLGAKRALRRAGHEKLETLIESWGLVPMPSAMTLPGDVVALPGKEGGWPALAVTLSNGRLLGFLAGADGARGEGTVMEAAVQLVGARRADRCFLALYPLLELVDLAPFLAGRSEVGCISWILAGDEAERPADPAWIPAMALQAALYGVPLRAARLLEDIKDGVD